VTGRLIKIPLLEVDQGIVAAFGFKVRFVIFAC